MQVIYFIVLAVAILHVYGAPSVHPAQPAIEIGAKGSVQEAKGKEIFSSIPTNDHLLNLFGIGKLIECYKQYDLDFTNLPHIENLSTEKKRSIFNTCSPIFHITTMGVGNTSVLHPKNKDRDDMEVHDRRRRSRRRTKTTGTTTEMPSTTTEVQVIVAGLDIITDVIRLQFLFLTTLFGGLSGCIATEGFPQSVCILQSLSNAFAVLTLELGET